MAAITSPMQSASSQRRRRQLRNELASMPPRSTSVGGRAWLDRVDHRRRHAVGLGHQRGLGVLDRRPSRGGNSGRAIARSSRYVMEQLSCVDGYARLERTSRCEHSPWPVCSATGLPIEVPAGLSPHNQRRKLDLDTPTEASPANSRDDFFQPTWQLFNDSPRGERLGRQIQRTGIVAARAPTGLNWAISTGTVSRSRICNSIHRKPSANGIMK